MKDAKQDERTLWRELKDAVDRELARRDASPHGGLQIFAKLGALAALIMLGYVAILTFTPSLVWLSAWAALGVATFFLIVNAAHDASHGTLFRSALANRAVLLGSFGLLGIDGALWGLRHRSAHHPHTNVTNVDTDSVENPFLRLSPHHRWRPWFRLQQYYAVLLYAFALGHTAFIQDFEHLFFRRLPYLARIRSQREAWIRLLLVKFAYLGIFLLLPWLAARQTLPAGVALSWVAAGIAVQFVASSLVFVLTICLNHYVLETEFYPEEGAATEEHHLLHQLRSSADWHATSRLCCAVMGGANAHTAHHLFPGISHRHYYWVSEIIADFARRHSLPYNSFSFAAGLRSHFQFLDKLGRRPVNG